MNFITPEFVLALPLVVFLFRFLPQRGRPWLLLAVSSIAYLYWNGWAFFLLLAVEGCSWGGAVLISKAQSNQTKKFWIAVTAFLILSQLFVFKYLEFTIHIVCPSAPKLNLILPVGISFYTFQALGYVLDTAAGQAAIEHSFLRYVLFITYFPQLVAGPIERSENLLPQLKACPTPTRKDWQAGIMDLFTGFLMKLCIADPLATFVEPVYANSAEAGGMAVLIGTVCFAFQIYCDFAGYSFIAIGTSRLLGIRLMKNFDQPYAAVSVRDFWRRWHISLTQWFTDYVYKPLGGNRKGSVRQCINLMIVFLISGLWHGANWTFVLWGILHGLYMTVELFLERYLPKKAWWRSILTFSLVCFAWIFFRAESVADAVTLVSRLITAWSSTQVSSDLTLLRLDLTAGTGIILRCMALAVLPSMPKTLTSHRDWQCFFLLFLAVVVGFLIAGQAGGENTFIYFRF